MEEYHDNDTAQYVTEKVLPSVISVEESNCLLCRRPRKFYSCRQCRDDGHLSFFTQLPDAKKDGRENLFPGVINGLAKSKVTDLKHFHCKLKDEEKRASEETAHLGERDKLGNDIILIKKRMIALRHMRQLQINGMKKLQTEKKNIQLTIDQLQRRSQRTRMKKSKISEYMNTKKYVVEKKQASLMRESKHLVEIRKQQLSDLVKYIFPIVGMSQDESFHSDGSSDDNEFSGDSSMNILETELAEARRHNYVHGRWIYDLREGPDLLRISISSSKVHAPADGNYTACEAWLKNIISPEDTTESSTTSIASHHLEIHNSSGASIYAALCLASHLMHTLWKVLNFHMPYKLHYRQFCKPNMTVQEFLWTVHKLNGNVLAFCLRYGVDPRLIHPLHTLSNIQNAVQVFLHNDSVPLSILSRELVKSLEEALDESSDLLPDDDDEKMEESLSEWENSLAEEDLEVPIQKQFEGDHRYTSAAPFQSQAQQHDDLGESQGLMSSAVAWVTKGWWNR